MIDLTACKISKDDIEMIGGIDFNTFSGYQTVIIIGGKSYKLEFVLSHKQRAWESDMRGHWQDYFFTQINKMASNIQRDEIKNVKMNISFTLGGCSLTLSISFTEVENEIRKLKKIINKNKNKKEKTENE